MTNPFIPRETVHTWSEEIGDHPEVHQTSLQRQLKSQRRLTRWIEQNAAPFQGASAGICVYLTGVVARMYELAGGRLKNATWATIREVEGSVQQRLVGLLPMDGFTDRLKAFGDRAQPHILDEAVLALFEAQTDDDTAQLEPTEALKVLAVLWVVIEVLDHCWTPPAGFVGETTYTHVPIAPPAPSDAPEDTAAEATP